MKRGVRQHQALLRDRNAQYGTTLALVPREAWPTNNQPPGLAEVWRSRRLLVQVFEESGGVVRLTVCRTEIDRRGEWRDDISWDDLQAVKQATGYGACEAVEIFPPDADVVNVANMRHLWVLPREVRMPFSWRSKANLEAPCPD